MIKFHTSFKYEGCSLDRASFLFEGSQVPLDPAFLRLGAVETATSSASDSTKLPVTMRSW